MEGAVLVGVWLVGMWFWEVGSVLAEWVGAGFDGFGCSEGAEEMGGWGWWWHGCGVGVGVGWDEDGMGGWYDVGCDVLWGVGSGEWLLM
jgi:hypothetical protein